MSEKIKIQEVSINEMYSLVNAQIHMNRSVWMANTKNPDRGYILKEVSQVISLLTELKQNITGQLTIKFDE